MTTRTRKRKFKSLSSYLQNGVLDGTPLCQSNLLSGCGFIWTPFFPDLDQAMFEPSSSYTFPNPFQICSRKASFGHLSVQIWIKPFSSPGTHAQIHYKYAPIWLQLDNFPSRSKPSHLRRRVHLPETIADLFPYGFIWTRFCPDLSQAIFEPRCTFPWLLRIYSHMAFG